MAFSRIQVRYASVLASLPPSPHTQHLHPVTQHIVTPSSQPLTAPSNNAFNPDFIPKNTKERLALSELYKVLNNSKVLLRKLQPDNDFVQKQREGDDFEIMLEEHCEHINILL
jgi:hypothetical protein